MSRTTRRLTIVLALFGMLMLGIQVGYQRGVAQGARMGIDAAIDIFESVNKAKDDADFPEPSRKKGI